MLEAATGSNGSRQEEEVEGLDEREQENGHGIRHAPYLSQDYAFSSTDSLMETVRIRLDKISDREQLYLLVPQAADDLDGREGSTFHGGSRGLFHPQKPREEDAGRINLAKVDELEDADQKGGNKRTNKCFGASCLCCGTTGAAGAGKSNKSLASFKSGSSTLMDDRFNKEDELAMKSARSIWCCRYFDDKWWCLFHDGVGLRVVLMVPFLMLMFLCTGLIIYYQQLETKEIIDELGDVCRSSTLQLFTESLKTQNFTITNQMYDIMSGIRSVIYYEYLQDAVVVLTTTYNMMDSVLYVSNPNNTTASFLYSVSNMLFYQLNSAYSGAASGSGLTYITDVDPTTQVGLQLFSGFIINRLSGPSNFQGWRLNYTNDKYTPNSTNPTDIVIRSCSISSDGDVSDCGQLDLGALNVDSFTFQRALSRNASQRSLFLWTPFAYSLESHLGPTFPFNKTWGITISWPINVCETYACFAGSMYANLYGEVLSALSRGMVQKLSPILDGQRYCDVCTLYTVLAVPPSFPDGTNVPNQTGLLVGGGDYDNVFQVGEEAYALNYTSPNGNLVQEATKYLISRYVSYQGIVAAVLSSHDLNNVIVEYWNRTSMAPCQSINDIQHGIDLEDPSLPYKDCIILTVGLTSTASLFQSTDYKGFNDFYWISVYTFPLIRALQNYTNAVMEFEETTTKTKQQADDKKAELLGASTGIGALLLILTAVVAFIISSAITRPIKNLEKILLQLCRLEFVVGTKLESSRIKQVARVQRAMMSMYCALEAFARFVPAAVVKDILRRAKGRRVNVRKRAVTIMFLEIGGFGYISENIPLEDLLSLMTTYISGMTHIVEAYQGAVAEFEGNGLLVYWNTPEDIACPVTKSFAAALAVKFSFCILATQLNQHRKDDELFADGDKVFDCHIAVNHGQVLTGVIGSDRKMKFGCMGDPVNLTSRMMGLCSLYGVHILCSETSRNECEHVDKFIFRELDLVQVKGKTVPCRIYELVSQIEPIQTSFKASTSADDDDPFVYKDRGVLSKLKQMKTTTSKLFKPNGSKAGMSERENEPDDCPPEADEVSVDDEEFKTFFPSGCHPLTEDERQRIQTYETALHLYQAGNFKEAGICMDRIPSESMDKAETYLHSRIHHAINEYGDTIPADHSPPWTGVNQLHAKSF